MGKNVSTPGGELPPTVCIQRFPSPRAIILQILVYNIAFSASSPAGDSIHEPTASRHMHRDSDDGQTQTQLFQRILFICSTNRTGQDSVPASLASTVAEQLGVGPRSISSIPLVLPILSYCRVTTSHIFRGQFIMLFYTSFV